MKYLTLTLTLLGMMFTNLASAGWDHNPRHYKQRHYQAKHYYKHHKHKQHNGNAAYALGGLLVGGIIGAQMARPVYQRPYVVNKGGYANPYPLNGGNSFFRNAYGECFLITYGYKGDRILSPVPVRNCQ